MKKYLLSTGRCTSRIEYYLLDLFKIYLNIYPEDIPGAPGIGFNFIINDVRKEELPNQIRELVTKLVDRVTGKYRDFVDISIEDIYLVDEKTVNLVMRINSIEDTININISDRNS